MVIPRVKRLRERLDDTEVRQARHLVRPLRSAQPPQVVVFGDSTWVFTADYDEDRRSLSQMLVAELGPNVSVHVCAGAGYHPALVSAYVRLIARHKAQPIVIAPLCARMASVAWSTHPRYSYVRAIERIDRIAGDAPLRSIRAALPEITPADFERYGRTVIRTWAGEAPIHELREPLRNPAAHGLSEDERRTMLYAYHHGERLDPAQRSLQETEALGAALRSLGPRPVLFETPAPVDDGVVLWGEQFRETLDHNLRLLSEAVRRGYGEPIDVLPTGTAFERAEFIDPADGSEHLNERGRRHLAAVLAEATKAMLESRSA